MHNKLGSVLVVGFNTRPLAYSLKKAGYTVYAVDFFGDLDLYPNVKDCIIVSKKLGTSYNLIKGKYSKFLAYFTLNMLKKYPEVNYLLIGSGLDDAFEERESILNEIDKKENYNIENLNNDLEIIKKARDIEYIYKILVKSGYKVPITQSYDKCTSSTNHFQFPFVFKKKKSAGGTNVYKINNDRELSFLIKRREAIDFNSSEWFIQEYIEGIPVSCTTISNGEESLVLTINRQIIGLSFLNPPKEFMYCGNIVPSNLLKNDEKLVAEISLLLSKKLKLKGINGFDFVIKKHHPYLMEINPRIPGSISASESVLNLNLLDLHIQSFNELKWENVKNKIMQSKLDGFATKLIIFAPHQIDIDSISDINNLKNVHDKSKPTKKIEKHEPLVTILYKDSTFSQSFFGALKIADKIKEIIK